MRNKIRSRFALAAAMVVLLSVLLSGCNSASLRKHVDQAFAQLKNGYVDDTNTFVKSETFAATLEQLEILSEMNEVLSNEVASLYIGENYDIALYDKYTGAIWFSNRALYEDSFSASDADLSQLALHFYDATDTLFTMYSHPDAYDGEGVDQVTVETLNDVATVTYAFGTRLEDLVISPAFSAETYNALVEKASGLIEQGELSYIQSGRFKMGYIQLVYDDLSPADRSAYTQKYPKFPELGEIYVLKPSLTNLQKREIEEISQKLGLTAQSIEEETSKLGELANTQKESPYFEVTLEYRLDGRDLVLTVDPQKIYEQNSYKLCRIEMLGGLGAVTVSPDHYLFVPDGSGAIINTKQDVKLLRQVSLPFYGSDIGVDIRNQVDMSSECPFPVFGMCEGTRALVAVAESGEALAGVTAALPDDSSVYARITPYYTYRVLDTIDLNGMGDTSEKNVYSDEISIQPLVLRYHPLYGDNANYSGMARYYRQYLLQQDRMVKSESAVSSLDIDILGAFTKKEMHYGIQMEVSKSATDFAQAKQIIENLSDLGVAAFNVQYVGMFNSGLDFSISSTAEIEEVLQGSLDFDGLNQAMNKANAVLYPSIDFTQVYRKGNGLNQKAQLARYLSKNYATYPAFMPADGERSKERIGYLVSPAAYNNVVSSFINEYTPLNNKQLFLSSLGCSLYGDYHDGDEVDREESKLLTVEALKSLYEAGLQLKLDGANAYTLPYATALTNVAVNCKNYSLYSTSVPFVGMVLHGYVPYSAPAINRQGNRQEFLLKVLESGAALHYMLMGEDSIVFADTAYSEYFSLSANQWYDEISANWKKIYPAYALIGNATMDSHETIQEGVVACHYSNGITMYINYNDYDVTLNGNNISAKDFCVEGGKMNG